MAISEIAREVVATRDYSRRAPRIGDDEAAELADSFNAMLTEIEEAAVAVPGVAEAGALGVRDERLGQAVLLLLRAADPDISVAVAAHLKAELPNFMQPRETLVLAQFPRNPNGKIDRVALAKEYAS